jgi:hypothetical protein
MWLCPSSPSVCDSDLFPIACGFLTGNRNRKKLQTVREKTRPTTIQSVPRIDFPSFFLCCSSPFHPSRNATHTTQTTPRTLHFPPPPSNHCTNPLIPPKLTPSTGTPPAPTFSPPPRPAPSCSYTRACTPRAGPEWRAPGGRCGAGGPVVVDVVGLVGGNGSIKYTVGGQCLG